MNIVLGIIIVIFVWYFMISAITKKSLKPPAIPDYDLNEYLANQDYVIAWTSGQAGDHKNAIYYYDQAISIKPKAIYYNNRAYSKTKTNDYKGAVEDYNKAIQLDPTNAQYLANRGMTFHNNDRKHLAYNDWRKASQLGSTDAKEWLEKHYKKTTIDTSSLTTLAKKITDPEETKKRIIQNKARFKDDWIEFKNILAANNISSLFHFTDRANLQSIQRHGALYSWHYCVMNNINIPVPGGNQLSRNLDSSKGVQNYVRVSFTRSHPMMFVPPIKYRNNVILEIDPEVIFWNNTKYANKNATSNDVNIGLTLDDFKQIKFNIVKLRNHFDLKEADKPYYQGEILVLEKIPLEFIWNLDNFATQTTKYDDLPF